MRKSKRLSWQPSTYLAVFFLLCSTSSFSAYQIKKFSINNGGTPLQRAQYQLNASVGQVVAESINNSNRFQLSSGFWQENSDLIFSNQF